MRPQTMVSPAFCQATSAVLGHGKEALTRDNVLDENRAKVVESGQLKTIITLLQEGPSELIPLLIPVIYNISVDYGETTPFLCA